MIILRHFHGFAEPVNSDAAMAGSGTSNTSQSSSTAASTPSPSLDSNPWTSHTTDSDAGESRSASTTSGSGTPPAQRAPEGQASEASRPGGASTDQNQQGQPAQTQQPNTQPAQPPVMTPEQMARIAAETAAQTLRQQQPTAQPAQKQEFTQADFNKAFNIPEVSAKTFQDIMGFAPDKPEQVTALNSFASSIIRAAGTMAQFMIQQAKTEVQGQIEPVARIHKERIDNEMRTEFFTKYPNLGDFKDLVQDITMGLRREGKQFDSKDELFQFVAARAHTLLGKAVQPGQPGTQPQTTTPPAAGGATRSMTPTSVGGQVSAASGAATRRSDAQSIFG